jgi:hypothetical protein
MINQLSKTKICCQKLLPHHQSELNEIHLSEKSSDHIQKLQAAFFAKKLWQKGSSIKIGFLGDPPDRKIQKNIIPYSKDLDPLQEKFQKEFQTKGNNFSIINAIKSIVQERIMPLVNLDISFTDISQANVRVSFDSSGGAWSLVGTDHLEEIDPNTATMNLGWFDVATTIHEFGHVIGMIHEHQNPLGQRIMWNEKKVIEWAKETQGWSEETTRQNIIDKYDKNSINGSSFDPLSIMLYFFSPDLTTNNIGTQQNFRLSGQDVLWINKIYPKDGGISPDNFYRDTYKMSLEDSINESNKLASKFMSGTTDENKSVNWKKIIIIIIIVFVLLLIIALLWKIFKP